MVFKSILLLTLTLLTNLCFCQTLGVTQLSEIQANPESTLCVDYNGLTLIDSFPESGMLRSYIVDEYDSILLEQKTEFQFDYENERLPIKSKCMECFNSIGFIDHNYDSLKMKQPDFIPDNNTLIHYKNHNSIKYMITQDTSLWCFNIIIESDKGRYINKLGNMSHGLLFADFKLLDFTGGFSPELFVFKHVLIGPNELTYIQIYSLTEE